MGSVLLLFLAAPVAAAEPDARALYRLHCGGCHGQALEGGLAEPLIKSDWRFGRDGFSVESNIRHGIPGTDMPGYLGELSDEEMSALVELIYSRQTEPTWIARPLPSTVETEHYTLRVEYLATDELENPWGIEFTGPAEGLISEDAGYLLRYRDGRVDPDRITGLPPVDLATSTGGLMDIALDPEYAENGWVYAAISHSEDPNDRYAPGLTRIIRGRVDGNRWLDTEYLFRLGPEYHLPDSKHWGGRLLFDREGLLYFSIGDMSAAMNSQDAAMPSGKVFRIRPDGGIPEDNPFAGEDGALGAVFTLGNRNVQGMAQHPETGAIWAAEHGPRGGDELNLLAPGGNYGWPVVTFGVNYDGSVISDRTHADGIVPPVVEWTPGLAVGPIEFVSSPGFERWRGDLLVGSLSFEELRRLEIDGGRVTRQELLFKGHGRIRDIKTGPDGALYLLLNNPGALVRLTAAPTTAATAATAIEHATLIPMTSRTPSVLEDHTLVIRDERIADICPSSPGCTPAGAQVIDGAGRFVIPALADMHNHFGGFAWDGTDASRIRMRDQNLRQYVMFGVATTRDPSGGRLILEMRDAIERDELFGPRIFVSSPLMDGDPPLFPVPRTFTEPGEAAEFIRRSAAEGYDLAKVYTALSPEVFDAVMTAAAEVGLTVAAHVPIRVPLEHALERGLRSIEHLTGYDVACAAPHVRMKPVPRDIYQGWAWCSPDKVAELAALTARYEVWNVPTLALWDSTVTEFDRPERDAGEIGKYEHPTTPGGIAWLYNLYGPRERAGITGTRSARLGLVKALHDAGAPLLIGTDVSAAGYTVHREMGLFVEAGLTPYQTLEAATSEAARYMNREGEFGVLAVGARGDVLLLDANPLDDIANARRIRGLMFRDRWWSKQAIDAELEAIQREYAEDEARLRELGIGPAQ